MALEVEVYSCFFGLSFLSKVFQEAKKLVSCYIVCIVGEDLRFRKMRRVVDFFVVFGGGWRGFENESQRCSPTTSTKVTKSITMFMATWL